MRLTVHCQFMLKDLPKDYRGLRSERWTFGKDDAVPIHYMARAILEQLFNYYGIYEEPDTLNEQMDILREWLQGIKFVEVEKQP